MKSKGLLVLRIVAGLIFALHGWAKLTGNPSIDILSGMIGNLGFPMPLFFAWVVALTEFLGGLALILGLFVRPAAILLSIVMVVAFSMVKKFALPAGDSDLALFGILVALALMGPGRFSVVGMMKKDEKVCVEESAK